MPLGFWILVSVFIAALGGIVYIYLTAPPYALPTAYEAGRIVGLYFLPLIIGSAGVFYLLNKQAQKAGD